MNSQYSNVVFILALIALSVTGCSNTFPERNTEPQLATVFSTPPVIANESYAGLIGDVELAAVYSSQNGRFVGRIKNESSDPMCDVVLRVFVDVVGRFEQPVEAGPIRFDVIRAGGRDSFTMDTPVETFSTWLAVMEKGTCANELANVTRLARQSVGEQPHSGEEGGEQSHSEEERRGHSEEHEEGEESAPSIPIQNAFSETHQSLQLDVAFDQSRGMFQGHVKNIGHRTVCRSRVEIHLQTDKSVVELGPTIPVHLTPNETIHFVLSPGDRLIHSYAVHAERSRCR